MGDVIFHTYTTKRQAQGGNHVRPVVRSLRPEDGELLSRVQRRAVLALPAVHYSRPVTLAWAESFTPVLARTVLTLSTTSS